MPIDPLSLGVSLGSSLLGGLFGGGKRKAAKRAAAEKRKLQNKLDNFKRQEIINPYEDVQNLSSMLTNPFENIGVATQAAEMQAEEADIALANTLDTLAATGAGAGGATALAQAALRSKKDISSSIERQEANNQQLAAQGEQALQQQQMAEAQRLQQAEVLGKEFVYGQQEQRDIAEMNRLQAQITGKAQEEANLMQQASAIQSSMSSAFGNIGSAFLQGGGFKG
jgi:hypothetical protein